MKKTFIYAGLATLIALAPLAASAQSWTAPAGSPPTANVSTPINVGASDQTKLYSGGVGNLTLQGGLFVNGLRSYLDSYFDGKVGIGTVSPTLARLDVTQNSAVSPGSAIKFGTLGFLVSPATTISDNGYWNGSAWANVSNAVSTYMSLNGGQITFATSPAGASPSWTSQLTILNGGNVGIGTASPGAKLEVAGQVKITGGTPGAGKVLTSDAAGLATWTTPAAGGGTVTGSGTGSYIPKWTSSSALGNSIIYDTGTNVGIGTASPTRKLHVYDTSGTNESVLIENPTNANGYTQILLKGTGRQYQFGVGNASESGLGVANKFYIYDSAGSVRMVVDTAGSVGIGTTNPGVTLDVAGNIRAQAAWLRNTGAAGWYNETYNGGWYMSDTTWIRSFADKSLWMGAGVLGSDGGLTVGYGGAIPASGNAIIAGSLGVGVSSPAYKLDVAGPIHMSTGSIIHNSSHGDYEVQQLLAAGNGGGTGDAALYSWVSEPGATWTGAGIGRNMRNVNATFPRINTGLTGQMIRFDEGTGINFTVETAGGSRTNPFAVSAGQVAVTGNLCLNGVCQASWPGGSSDTLDTVLGRGSSTSIVPSFNGGINVGSGQNIVFNAASDSGLQLGFGTNVYRMASDGRLRLTAQNNIVDVSSTLQVNGLISLPYNTTYNPTYGESRIDTGNRDLRFRLGASAGQPAQAIFERLDGQTNFMTLSVAGNVTANGINYSSDRTLKANIKPLEGALDKVLNLQGVSFNWKAGNKADVGVVAQDVEKIYPELVTTDKNTGLKSVEYANLVAPLIEAVKEQQKQIDALKDEVQALKAAK